MSIVVLGIFDNDAERSLPNLKREEEEIDLILTPLKSTKNMIYYTHHNLGMEGMIRQIRFYREVINWFHFSGHHDKDKGIKLADGNLESLAINLSQCPNLQGVFINGCSSKETILKLQEHVPVCIGTSKPVYDGVATKFSTLFYEELNSIDKWNSFDAIHSAFEIVKASTKDLITAGKIEDTTRGAGSLDDFEEEFYIITEANDDAKNKFNGKGLSHNVNFEKNNFLKKLLSKLSEDEDGSNYHEKMPYVLGKYIQAFNIEGSAGVTPKYREYGLERHNLIKEFFYSYLDLCRFSILSILWEEILTAEVDCSKYAIKNLFKEVTTYRAQEIDTLSKLCGLIIGNFGVKTERQFVDEIMPSFELFYDGVNFYREHLYEGDLDKIHWNSELLLHRVITSCKSLNPYKIQSVHSRFYVKERNEKQHKFKVEFIRSSRRKEISIEEENSIKFVNIHSVYLFQKSGDMNVVIDLSPFFLDKNSHDPGAKKMGLIVLNRYHEEDELFTYRDIYDPLVVKPRPKIDLTSYGFSYEEESERGEEYTQELSKFQNVFNQLNGFINSLSN